MSKKTQKECFVTALINLGEHLIKSTLRYDVYSRAVGKYYYIGRAGSLRVGATVAASIPVSGIFKRYLIEAEGKESFQSWYKKQVAKPIEGN